MKFPVVVKSDDASPTSKHSVPFESSPHFNTSVYLISILRLSSLGPPLRFSDRFCEYIILIFGVCSDASMIYFHVQRYTRYILFSWRTVKLFVHQGYIQNTRTQYNALTRKSYSTDFYQICTPVLKNRCSDGAQP